MIKTATSVVNTAIEIPIAPNKKVSKVPVNIM